MIQVQELAPSEVVAMRASLPRLKVAQLKELLRACRLKYGARKQEFIDNLDLFIKRVEENNDQTILLAIKLLLTMLDSRTDLPPLSTIYNNLRSGSINYRDTLQELNTQGGRTYQSTKTPYRSSLTNHQAALSFATPSYAIKPSPFYSVIHDITGSPCIALGSSLRLEATMSFSLKKDEQKLILESGARVYVMMVAPDSGSTELPIAYPEKMELLVNSHTIKDSGVRGISNVAGTARPFDITSYTKPLSNKVRLLFIDERKFYLYVKLCVKYSAEEVLSKITFPRITRDAEVAKIVLKRSKDDDDISVGLERVSLKCPLSYVRINIPVKSDACDHTGCFDALSFIALQEQVSSWKCPLCLRTIQLDQLKVSEYFEDILKACDEESETVSIEEDGSWSVVKENEQDAEAERIKRERSLAQSKKQEMQEVIVLDSDEEMEDDNQAHQQSSIPQQDPGTPPDIAEALAHMSEFFSSEEDTGPRNEAEAPQNAVWPTGISASQTSPSVLQEPEVVVINSPEDDEDDLPIARSRAGRTVPSSDSEPETDPADRMIQTDPVEALTSSGATEITEAERPQDQNTVGVTIHENQTTDEPPETLNVKQYSPMEGQLHLSVNPSSQTQPPTQTQLNVLPESNQPLALSPSTDPAAYSPSSPLLLLPASTHTVGSQGVSLPPFQALHSTIHQRPTLPPLGNFSSQPGVTNGSLTGSAGSPPYGMDPRLPHISNITDASTVADVPIGHQNPTGLALNGIPQIQASPQTRSALENLQNPPQDDVLQTVDRAKLEKERILRIERERERLRKEKELIQAMERAKAARAAMEPNLTANGQNNSHRDIIENDTIEGLETPHALQASTIATIVNHEQSADIQPNSNASVSTTNQISQPIDNPVGIVRSSRSFNLNNALASATGSNDSVSTLNAIHDQLSLYVKQSKTGSDSNEKHNSRYSELLGHLHQKIADYKEFLEQQLGTPSGPSDTHSNNAVTDSEGQTSQQTQTPLIHKNTVASSAGKHKSNDDSETPSAKRPKVGLLGIELDPEELSVSPLNGKVGQMSLDTPSSKRYTNYDHV